ncbi:TniQ family protein [Henriciella sp. AS95]|uniref:TniQ family protein n=1 Tax=Henriciella sp. AS95 TaxID=3135782 RepID=UPI00316D12DB
MRPFPGEPANSIVGRVAARNGASFAQDFCADMNASWRAVSVGECSEISGMSELTGISLEELRRYTVRVRGHRAYKVNGQHLTRKTLDRGTLKVCPLCLVEDLKVAGELGRHCRVEWLLSCYQVCHVHRTLMLSLPDAEYPRCPYDFYQRIRDHWACIRRSAETVELVNGDLAWETYLASRIRGFETDAWCDNFNFDVTCCLALNLGTVIRFGASRNPSDLKPGEISRAADSAFEAMKSGRKSLSSAFRVVREASGSPKPGFHTDFGAFARWLYRVDHSGVRCAELLDIVTEFAFENYPFGAGDVLFGRTCRKRRIHNITSAAKQHSLKYPGMTSLVLGLGLGKDGCHERIEFSAQEYDPILNEFAQCLRPKPAARKIGVHLSMLQRLVNAQILKPRFDFPSMLPVYHPDDLDEFTASVFKHARVVTNIPTDHILLIKLCTHAKCYFEEVVQAAQSGSLSSLCRLPTAVGVQDCFADLEDLRDQIQAPAPGGYTKQDAKRLLRVNDPTVTLLVRNSLLRAQSVRHHRSRRPMTLISSSAMSEFLQHHATLGMMAHAAGTQAVHVATKLEKAGVEPLPLGARFSKIYERTPKLENLFCPGRISRNRTPARTSSRISTMALVEQPDWKRQ